jgi:hypothetical protein
LEVSTIEFSTTHPSRRDGAFLRTEHLSGAAWAGMLRRRCFSNEALRTKLG